MIYVIFGQKTSKKLYKSLITKNCIDIFFFRSKLVFKFILKDFLLFRDPKMV